MQFMRKYAPIFFIIAFITFIGFHIYRNFKNDISRLPAPPSYTQQKNTDNKDAEDADINNSDDKELDNKGFSLKNPDNKDLPDTSPSSSSDTDEDIAAEFGDSPYDYNNDMTDADLLGDDTADVNLIEKPEEKQEEPQKTSDDLPLPDIEEVNIDNLSDDPIGENDDIFGEDNKNETTIDTSPDRNTEKTNADTTEDTPFSDEEFIGDDSIYAALTEDDDLIAEEENEDFVENTPDDIKSTNKDDNADDIFSDPDLGLETTSQKAENDIFSNPEEAKETSQKTSEPTAQESLDEEFLSQIDTPDDLLLPDTRKVGETDIMITPTEEADNKEDINEDLFPVVIDKTDKDDATTDTTTEITETNKALEPKENWNDNDLFSEDDLFSDVISKNDTAMSDDIETTENQNNGIEFPLVTEDNPDLPKPALLKDKSEMSPQEKIAVTPFTTMKKADAHCNFEHVIDAYHMSEQFRLTVMPPNGETPLKMEIEQDLSLEKFLTMKMDEVDGYPDAFSSLSVFCKDMTISKRLIENY